MNNFLEPDCPDCGHAKLAHVKALGFCTSCYYMDAAGVGTGRLCRRVYVPLYSQDEIEKLTRVPRDSFGQWDVCAVCEAYWMEHTGALCPSGNSTFKPVVGYS